MLIDDILKNKSYLSGLIDPILNTKRRIESNLELSSVILEDEMIYLLEGEQLVVRGVTKREIFVEGKVKNLKIITGPTE